jgi:hypothetical protein
LDRSIEFGKIESSQGFEQRPWIVDRPETQEPLCQRSARHRGHEQDIADDLLQTLGEHVNEALAFEGSSNRESKGSTRRAKNS